MAKTQKEFEEEELLKGLDIANKQYTDRQKIIGDSINNYNSTVDKQVTSTVGEYENAINEGAAKYDSMIDANAINELVAKKNLEESMANAGLTNSGLNRTQQTALTIQRGNADQSVRQSKAEFENNLRTAIAKVKQEAETQKAEYANQQNTDLASWYSDLLANTRSNAYQNSVSRYNAQVEAENDAIKAQQDYTLKMINAGYVPDGNGGFVKETESTSDLNTQKAIVAQSNKLQSDFGYSKAGADIIALGDYGQLSGNDLLVYQAMKNGMPLEYAQAYVYAMSSMPENASNEEKAVAVTASLMDTAKNEVYQSGINIDDLKLKYYGGLLGKGYGSGVDDSEIKKGSEKAISNAIKIMAEKASEGTANLSDQARQYAIATAVGSSLATLKNSKNNEAIITAMYNYFDDDIARMASAAAFGSEAAESSIFSNILSSKQLDNIKVKENSSAKSNTSVSVSQKSQK